MQLVMHQWFCYTDDDDPKTNSGEYPHVDCLPGSERQNPMKLIEHGNTVWHYGILISGNLYPRSAPRLQRQPHYRPQKIKALLLDEDPQYEKARRLDLRKSLRDNCRRGERDPPFTPPEPIDDQQYEVRRLLEQIDNRSIGT